MGLPSADSYAVILVAFFAQLDLYDEFTRPGRPPAPDLRDGDDEPLKNLRSAAQKEALQRWEIHYLQPWNQRKEERDRKRRRDRKRQRRDEQRSIQSNSAPFTSQLEVMILVVRCATLQIDNHPLLIRISSALHPLLICISSSASSSLVLD